jgi:hypothetical protein
VAATSLAANRERFVVEDQPAEGLIAAGTMRPPGLVEIERAKRVAAVPG